MFPQMRRMEVNNMSMYYDYNKIDGYKCPIKIVVSQRGLGKTFGKVKSCIEKFIDKGYRFIYVVETGEMVNELTRNNGEKFFASILKFYSTQDTARKRYYYSRISSTEVDNEGNVSTIHNTKITGGTIKINGDTAGYILDMNSFGELKRNNFVDVKTIIVDEFISEKLDKTTLQNPKRVASIVQSIARTSDVRVYLLGNAVRKDDPILARIGFKIKDYGLYKRYDKYGLVAVLDFVNPNDYDLFNSVHDKSTSGRFSRLLGEDNEEQNKFKEDLPEGLKLNNFRYKRKGFRVDIIRDNQVLSLRELVNGNIAVVPFDETNQQSMIIYCLTPKEQGYYKGRKIVCNKLMEQSIYANMSSGNFRYYSEIEYATLKSILKGSR